MQIAATVCYIWTRRDDKHWRRWYIPPLTCSRYATWRLEDGKRPTRLVVNLQQWWLRDCFQDTSHELAIDTSDYHRIDDRNIYNWWWYRLLMWSGLHCLSPLCNANWVQLRAPKCTRPTGPIGAPIFYHSHFWFRPTSSRERARPAGTSQIRMESRRRLEGRGAVQVIIRLTRYCHVSMTGVISSGSINISHG